MTEQQGPTEQVPQVSNVIENLPMAAEYDFFPFKRCLRSVMAHLGRETSMGYLAATSGSAFGLVWHTGRWEGAHADIMFLAEDPLEPFRRALASVGYDAEFLLNGTQDWDDHLLPASVREAYLADLMVTGKNIFRDRIVASIDRGVPVIALGIVEEACIITGYDDSGAVLIGVEPLEQVDFRTSEWFEKLVGIIVPGDESEVDQARIYRRTLEWIPRLFRTPMIRQSYTGQKVYDLYLERLLDDSAFPADDMSTLEIQRGNHYECMTMIAARGAGGAFLQEMAEHPGFAAAKRQLLDAGDAYVAVYNEMPAWWDIVGAIWNDRGDAQARATADPEVRRKWVTHVRTSQRKELEAVEHVEHALDLLS